MSPIVGRGTTPLPDPAVLFARHLDLTPLGGRRRGLVRCAFHEDKTASLSVDLDAGVFNCFGCGEQGGVWKFSELVGERGPEPYRAGPPETELQQARRRVMREEHSRQALMAEWGPLLHAMSGLRVMERLIATVRAAAPDSPTGWEALEDAALVERFVDARTAEIEGLLAAGRVA
jgi:hypothetical protein